MEQDIPEIVALLRSDALGRTRESMDGDDPAYQRAFAAMGPQNFVLVAIERSEMIGCLQVTFIVGLTRRGTTRAQLEGMQVRADRRGQGVGSALLRTAAESARAAGCGLLQLSSHEGRVDAMRFFAAHGFVGGHVAFKKLL